MRKSVSPCAKKQFSSLHSPDRKALQSFVFCRFGAKRSSAAECAYLQFADAHFPRSKKAHILVFVSCIVTALSRSFVLFSLVDDLGDTMPVFFGIGDLPIFGSARAA